MANILAVILKHKGCCDITINGTSMEPVLHDGDICTVKKQEQYTEGDILVYEYRNEGLLAHRLLKLDRNRYFCKGDNSLRLEDITAEQILGAIGLSDDPNRNEEFIAASYSVSRLFRRCGYDREKTMEQDEYRQYKEKYLEKTK